MSFQFDSGIFSIEGLSGEILPGTALAWYETGSSTFLATYSDPGLSVPNTNPIFCAADGRLPPIWLQDRSYKMVMTLPNGTTLTRDPVRNPGSSAIDIVGGLSAPGGADLVGYLQAGSGSATRTIASKLNETMSVKDKGAKGDNSTNDTGAMLLAEAQSSSVYWPIGTYVVDQVPDLAKSWGPGTVMVGGNRVYLRPTAEPAQAIFGSVFGPVLDGIANDSVVIQRGIDFAQDKRLPYVFPPGASIYLGAGLTAKQGRAAADDPFTYSADIDFNGCTLYPGPGVRALDIVPRCLLADAATSRGNGNITLRGGVTFDGSKGDATSRAYRIGKAGYHCSPFEMGVTRDILVHLFSPAVAVVEVIEARHINPSNVVVRAGFARIQSDTPGSFCGDQTWNDCEFTGTANNEILTIKAENSSGAGAIAQVRGVRFNNTILYGPLTSLRSIGRADVGDIWFNAPQFEGPYDGSTGGRALDIIADGATARVFAVFLNTPYFAGHKGPAMYARPINGGDIRSLHIISPDCAAFTISAATAVDVNCNTLFAMSGVRGFELTGGTLTSITGDGATSIVNIQSSRNGSVTGLTGDNFTGVLDGVTANAGSDRISMIGNLLPVTSANVAANFGAGTQFVIANNLKVV